jgi:hypothetical protein
LMEIGKKRVPTRQAQDPRTVSMGRITRRDG